ncbi:MAG: helix-turn-helix transcriptional regulator [Polaribacter sp.]|uniref:helix-turn-helix transcriptional regulator n=1 Tax=Polaribacter sp. TaxID=1920175 RepID=UPI003EF9174E
MTLTNQKNTFYPGMISSGVEFFVVEDEMNFISEGEIKSTRKLPYSIIQLTQEEIKKDAAADAALNEWHPASEFNRQNQFLKCRYGGLDFSADIENNQFKDGDYWDCPKRANCKYNGIICKPPKYNGSQLNTLDISLMKLLATTLTNETIADTLNLAFGSFHKLKQSLYAKLGIQTKQELALIAKSLNLI